MKYIRDHVILEYVELGSGRTGVRVDFSPHRKKYLARRDRQYAKLKLWLFNVLLIKGASYLAWKLSNQLVKKS